jgi:hypothetical protein
MLGVGDKALSLTEDEWVLWESLEDKSEVAQHIISMAAENAMLLAPSAECFLTWRERLRSVCADAPILREIGRRYAEEYEEGTPWWDFMARLATGFYSRSTGVIDQGRYGNGAATWQIMLANQKSLRLSADMWNMAAREYGTLVVRLFKMDERRLSGASQAVLREAALPVRLCAPYIRAYIENYPGDEVETVVYPPIREILERFGSE